MPGKVFPGNFQDDIMVLLPRVIVTKMFPAQFPIVFPGTGGQGQSAAQHPT